MYKVTFRGKDIEPAFIPEDMAGKQFYDLFLAGKLPRRIEIIEGRAIDSLTIKTVESGYGDGGNKKWEAPDFKRQEILDFKNKLSKFKQKRIGKRLMSRFDQYLLSIGITRYDEKTDTFVMCNPSGMKMADALMDELDKYEYGLQKRDEQLMREAMV